MDQSSSTSPDPAPAPAAPDLDPLSGNPRELMRALLPAARTEYIRAWELLADAATPLEHRRAGRARATAIGDDHAVIASALRGREASLQGDDLLNARHLAGELERHAEALGRLATVSPIGIMESKDLRPEALGCGRRYRDPSKRPEQPASKTRGVPDTPPAEREVRGGGRGRGTRPGGGGKPGGGKPGSGRPGAGSGRPPRHGGAGGGVKASTEPGKHDSQLGDDLDEATRAKLEALRKALES